MRQSPVHLVALAFGLVSLTPGMGQADPLSIYVPGIADPYLAGMPAGSTASGYTASAAGLDVAPTQSPVLVSGLGAGGTILAFSATGAVAYGPPLVVGDTSKWSGPAGELYNGAYIHHLAGAQNGISDAWVPINSLVGVFLDNNRPDTRLAPATLDFRSGGANYSSLSPALGQLFYVGAGSTLDNPQQVVAPPGATRLFLGVADGYEWDNNLGGYSVTVTALGVPEPGTLTLLAAGAACLGGMALRRRKSTALPSPGVATPGVSASPTPDGA